MNTKTAIIHTPGPWSALSGGPYVIQPAAALPRASADAVICITANNFNAVRFAAGVGSLEDKANATLIGAAPELLEACKACISAIWQHFEYHHDGDDEFDNDACQRAIDLARAAVAKAESRAWPTQNREPYSLADAKGPLGQD